mmetsp:Transcript_12056/g.28304  ORF Transcript_12056/g.28304 Transcript_12056/m.28304 type:complete len:483 (-) Transcript_12056:59-1507(-)|eukprot:CAMPEP_0171060128 /NCGR_PEP_ID=MMETSP0766_2-20121228/3635_1 /TAXON_ID=439317 /ORGANISM="Gambierdiscus australes, Strain CAWD 149" /LENGTH=482 /DNA_ID=CAMNT_0011515667 /DNA_START=74 /DNA_END=1522 /DNA_ORIENTATION=+
MAALPTDVKEVQPLWACEAPKGTYGSTQPSSQDCPETTRGNTREQAFSGTGDELLPLTKSGRYPFLDITRICCVWCVAVDHGNGSFGHWNIMFTQDWVLQYLFLVCGVCFGMTSLPLPGTLSRFFAYFVVGVMLNWLAWVITGRDWENNIFNVVFHMWFVVGVMLYSMILAPLKWYLKALTERQRRQAQEAGSSNPEAEHPEVEEGGSQDSVKRSCGQGHLWTSYRDTMLMTIVAIGGGTLFIVILFTVIMRPVIKLLAPGAPSFFNRFGNGAAFWGFPTSEQEATVFFRHFSAYFMSTATNIYLVAVCPRVLKQTSITTWLVVANTYAHRLLYYRAQDERFFHGFDIMLMGMSCYYLGMRHRRIIGLYIVRYWFALLLLCALLWPPTVHTRFDEDPPTDVELRIRVNLLELIFIVTWLVAGERLVQPEIFTEDKLDYLNSWGLLVFLIHKAVHITIKPPLNWTFLLLLAPVCGLLRAKFST